jgi:acetyl-CoA C-acetyltransferase
MSAIVITAATRTPVGSFLGALSSIPAHDLGKACIAAIMVEGKMEVSEISEVILGQVLTAAQGQNPPRQASMAAGIPKEVPAWGISQVCGSGLRAIALAAQAIQTGDATVVIAGGQESMSCAPYARNLRSGRKTGPIELIDTMIHDGLTDAFHGYHIGITAENVAEKYQITGEEQDKFAVRSQHLAETSRHAGRFRAEIVPVTVKGRKGDTIVAEDEHIRAGVTLESISVLRPAFKKEGTVTAANASGLNDGAAALLIMSEAEASRRGPQVLARIVSWASAGVDPAYMGLRAVPATRQALAKAGWSLDDVDLIEANEAFAAQALAVGKEMGWDPERVHVSGGAIAIGYPIGASGARVLTTLLHEMRRRGGKRGLATLCIGGGMGIAMCVER